MDKTENFASKTPVTKDTKGNTLFTFIEGNDTKTNIAIETTDNILHSNSNLSENQSTLLKCDENVSEIFDYLENTIRILGSRLQINLVPAEQNINPHYKIMLDMFSIILQYQCLTFKGAFKNVLNEKIQEISQNLSKIFQVFSKNSYSGRSEDLVEDFMEKTDDILKEIDLCFVDPDDNKQGILNQSLYSESFLRLHSFNDSVVNVSDIKSCFTPLKNVVEDSPNSQVDIILTHDTIKGNRQFNNDALRERISTFEKDIEEYRKSVLNFESDNKLKDKQLVMYKDKVEVQEQIITGLKDDLTLLINKESAPSINVNNQVTLVDCCTQTSDKLFNITLNNNVEVVESSSQTELLAFVNSYSQTESLTFVDGFSETSFEICDTISNKKIECSDSYSQTDDLSELAHNYSQTTDELHNVIPSNCYDDVFFNDYSKTEDMLNISPTEEKSLTEYSSQTSINLLKLPSDYTAQASTSSQTDLPGIDPYYDKLFAEQCTQTLDLSVYALPSNNQVSPSPNFLHNHNNIEINNIPNCNLEDAKNAKTNQNIYVINKNSDSEGYLKVSRKNETQLEMEAQIKVTLNDLIQLRIFALEFMKRDMKNFLGDIEFFENNESSPLLDQIKIEITALKELLVRLEFFIKYQNEHNEHFNTILEENNFENCTLKEHLSKLESNIKEKDVEFLSFGAALLDMEKTISELEWNLRNNENLDKVEPFVKWSRSDNFVIDKRTPVSHLKSLQKMMLSIDIFLNEKISSIMNLSVKLNETEDMLKQLKQKHQIPFKVTKYVQTLDEDKLLQVSQKLDEAVVCIEDLKKDINNLTYKLENVYNQKKILEHNLEVSNNKIKEMNDTFDEEKLSWTQNTMDCVKRVEAKCDQMMVEQENKFFDEINKLSLEHRMRLLDKSKSYRAEQEEWKCKMEDLKNEHQRNITEMNNKLGKEVEERYCEKSKLENKIKALEDSFHSVNKKNHIMKEKYQKFLVEYQRMKAHINKSVQERETQTNFLPTKQEMPKTSIQTKMTHNLIYIPEEISKTCHNCAVLMQKIADLQKTELNENLDDGETEVNKLKKELHFLKADVSLLQRNNKSLVKDNISLKQDLSNKLALLRSCRCRLNPIPLNDNLEVPGNPFRMRKTHETDQKDVMSSEIRNEILPNSTDILNNEIVRRAIEEAKLQERVLLNSGSGPDGTVKCLYLKRKLTKTEKELGQKNKELESLKNKLVKKQTGKRHAVEKSENQPVNAPEERYSLKDKKFPATGRSIHPFPEGEVPRVPPKKSLKEINRIVEFSNDGNLAQDPAEKKGILYGNKSNDRQELRRQQIEMLTGDRNGVPECKQQ